MRLRSTFASLLALATTATVAETTLDTVLVTATRSPIELADHAGSASILDSEDIERTAATHHSDLLNRVAGTQFQRNSGQESLTAIRSPVLTGPGSCGAFLFLEDSIPIRPVGFCNVNELFEVNFAQARAVEVLRGPAGVLYGSSAMHGAVNVLSLDPNATPALSLTLEGGENTYRRGIGVWSLGNEGNTLALAANITHDGGWRLDSKVDEQKANAAWHYQFANSSLDVRAAYARLDQDTAGFIIGRDAYRNEDIARSNPNPEAYRHARAARLTADWRAPLSTTLDLSVRPYVRSSRMDFIQHFLPGQPNEDNGQDSAGVMVGLEGKIDDDVWRAGIDIEYADMFLLQRQTAPTTGLAPAANAARPVGRHYDYTVNSAVAALYGRYDWVTGDFRFIAGARGERVEYDYNNRMLDGNTREDGTPCPLNATGCLYFRAPDRTDAYETFTPQLGMVWSIATSHSLFATAVRGYRAPDTNELFRLQRQQSTLPPRTERLDNAELGVRGVLGSFDYSLAAFVMRKENMILRDANGLNLSNARTKHRGIEYSLAWQPLEQVRLAIDGSSAIHRYDFTANIAGGESIVAGRYIDTAPRNVWNVRADFRPLEDLTAEVEWQHVGSYSVDAANQNFYEGHNVLNLRVGWRMTDQWAVAARVMNLADRAYADRADFAQGNYRYCPGRGRTLFAEVRYVVD